MSRSDKAALLRRLHHEPQILVLPNAWDVGSARVLAALPGCRALATTSAGVAACLGFEDGERTPVQVMVSACARIASAVEVPVTADLEHGYGDPVATAGAAWDGGIVGINFEDSTHGAVVPVEEQVAAIRSIRDAVPELVINARIDVFLRQAGGIDEAVERAHAYLAAGADCVYPIFCPTSSIADLARRIDGPVNVLALPDVPEPSELQALGVARLTWGSGLTNLAYAEAARVVGAALA
jgi:2-methylisocitrate lyase-like PEP mutase family enzyme